LAVWDIAQSEQKRYWSEKQKDVAESLAAMTRIEASFPRINLTIEQKQYPFDPCIKATIVEDECALLGFYVLEEHTKSPGARAQDYIGYKTKQVILKQGHWSTSGRVFKELRRWFEAAWASPVASTASDVILSPLSKGP
jgi:hypothetical protein